MFILDSHSYTAMHGCAGAAISWTKKEVCVYICQHTSTI